MSARFQMGDETFRDANTGHEWTVAVSAPLPLAAAHAYARDCRAGGHADWRVPARVELLTLVAHGTLAPATWPALRDCTPADSVQNWFWTSTPYAPTAGYAWVVRFFGSYTGVSAVTDTRRVRCVR